MSDVIRMTWNDYDGRVIRVKQKKTGKRLVIPVHKALRAILDAKTRIGITILTTPTGLQYAERGFSAGFLKARKSAGLEHLHFHGLRHTAAAKLKEAGCTTGEIQSITGQSLSMVEHYTKQSDQERVASAAIIKLERNESGT